MTQRNVTIFSITNTFAQVYISQLQNIKMLNLTKETDPS